MADQGFRSPVSSSAAAGAACESARQPATPARPFSTIRAGGAGVDLRELWLFRGLLAALAARDLKLRYKQTILGVVWVVLQPLIAAGIFAFVFGRVAHLPTDGVPAFLFAFCGLVGWNLFSNTLTRSGNCLIGNAQLVSKVFFPRLVLPLSTVLSALVDFAVSLALVAILMAVYRHMPTTAALATPIWILLLLMLATGAGFIAAALTVSYRDVQHIMPVVTQLLLYASPVAYSISAVPERFRFWYLLNPLAVELAALRGALLGTPMPTAGWIAYAASISTAVFIGGAILFRRMERRFADVI